MLTLSRDLHKKELSLFTPLIRNEINAAQRIRGIDKYETYFFPIVDYEMVEVGGRPRNQQLVLLTRWDPESIGVSFLNYFQENRYYVDIIETYKGVLRGLAELHSVGVVYGGFGALGSRAIMIERRNVRGVLVDFKYSYCWDRDGDDRFAFLLSGEKRMPPYMTLLLYLKKNKRTELQKRDVVVLERLVPLSILERVCEVCDGCETDALLKDLAFCWDVYEVSEIYFQLCCAITHNNKYFKKFVEILEGVVGGGVDGGVGYGALPADVLERLDHIIE